MEVNIGLASAEPEGLRIGDEMNLVATGSEFDAELRGDDAAAAIRRNNR